MTPKEFNYLREGMEKISASLVDLKRDFTEHRVTEAAILARHDEKIKQHGAKLKWLFGLIGGVLIAVAAAMLGK